MIDGDGIFYGKDGNNIEGNWKTLIEIFDMICLTKKK